MTEIVLYHCPRACSSVTMCALEHAGVEYEDRVINIFKGENKTPEYLKIHPGGKVPAMQVDGRMITENAALLILVDSLNPEAGLLPAGGSEFDQARVYSDLIWISGTVHPAVRQQRMPIRFTTGEAQEEYKGIQEKGVEYFHPIMQLISDRVVDGQWWYGDTWSIVDVYLSWCCGIAEVSGFPIDDYPNVRDLINRVREGASFQRMMARQSAAEKAAGLEFPPR